MADSPSPPAQAVSARASSDDVGVGSLPIAAKGRSGTEELHLVGVPRLSRLVPVARAGDRELADPAVGDDAVDQLARIPSLPLVLPALLEPEEKAAGRA